VSRKGIGEYEVVEPETDETEPWEPDIRWALPVVLVMLVWALGWLPAWSTRESCAGQGSDCVPGGFTPWLLLPVGLIGAFVGVWRARHAWPAETHGDALREQGSLLSCVAAVACTGWLIMAGYTSPWKQTALLLVIGAVCGVWYAVLITHAPGHARAQAERVFETSAGVAGYGLMRSILDQSKCADVKVYRYEETRAGWQAELGPDPAYAVRPTYGELASKLPQITTNLAIHWRAHDGTVLEDNDVMLESLAADRWILTVSTKHVLRETIEYRPRPAKSFNMPVWLGLFEDGMDMDVILRGRNLLMVGVMGGGKSVGVNNIIARALETRDAEGRPDTVIMCAACEKLIPLVGPWVFPWLMGQIDRPPIHTVVGEDLDSILWFLVRILKLARSRNHRLLLKSKHEASGSMPSVLVLIDEAKILTAKRRTIMWDGEEWTPSKLIAEIAPLTRSANMGLILVTQVGLFDGLGPYGDELQRHMTVRMCFETETFSDGMATCPKLPDGVDTTQLADNAMFLQRGLGEKSRAMRGKMAKLDEEDVLPVAIQSSYNVGELNDEDIEAMGREWHDTRWDAEYHPLLVAAANTYGRDWPEYRPRVHASDVPPGLPTTPPPPTGGGHSGDYSDDGDTMHPEPDTSWDDRDDDAFRRLLDDDRPVSSPGPDGLGGASRDELDFTEDLEKLDRLADEAERQADEIIRKRDEEDGRAAQNRRVAEPLRSILAWLDGLDERPEWVATETLAREVLGDEREEAARKLGLAMRGKFGDLTATGPRTIDGTGRKGRGYLVADLYRAAGE
jgi:hypothetical protein